MGKGYRQFTGEIQTIKMYMKSNQRNDNEINNDIRLFVTRLAKNGKVAKISSVAKHAQK